MIKIMVYDMQKFEFVEVAMAHLIKLQLLNNKELQIRERGGVFDLEIDGQIKITPESANSIALDYEEY